MQALHWGHVNEQLSNLTEARSVEEQVDDVHDMRSYSFFARTPTVERHRHQERTGWSV